jgi:hypothetical protein
MGKPGASVGKLNIAPGILLSATDKAAVNKWRVANALKELPLPVASKHQTAPVAPKAPLAAKDIVVAGVVFQDDQFMKSMVQGFQDAGTNWVSSRSSLATPAMTRPKRPS